MHPQRRTALVSVLAAATLVGIKLATGLATGSLGLVSEALHSGVDLVAALLTFFAVGVAIRPADVSHQYGHGKAEHLAALAEASILALASFGIVAFALLRLTGASDERVEPTWYAFAVVVAVLAIDAGRTVVSTRTARRYRSEALRSNAVHFGSDFAGSVAVLVGLVFASAGYPNADSLAGLFVAGLVLLAAGRLMRRNVDVLMDRAPADALAAAREAIAVLEPQVRLRRLRLRQAAGRHFADVVIGVSPGEAVGQGHAAADAVEEAVHRALPGSDIGLAIILLTVIIKILLYPLTHLQIKQQRAMQELQPQIDEIRKRLKDDQEAQAKELMELYKTEKINPLGGCLPIVVQIPVFIALYWVLLASVELRHAPFMLWIEDLAAAEEERFNRVKHGKRPLPFTAWELPYAAIDYCLAEAGIQLSGVDHVAYSYDPALMPGRPAPRAGSAAARSG